MGCFCRSFLLTVTFYVTKMTESFSAIIVNTSNIKTFLSSVETGLSHLTLLAVFQLSQTPTLAYM